MEDKTPLDPTRNRILETAFMGFNQHGYKGLSMESIAAELRISKKTIYKYFESKELLLESTIRENLNQIETQLKYLSKETPKPDSFLRMGALYLEYKKLFSGPIMDSITNNFPHFLEWIDLFEAQVFKKAFSKIAKELRTKNTIEYPMQTRELATGFFSMMEGLSGQTQEFREQMILIFLKGLSVKPRKKGGVSSKTKKKK